MLHWIGMYLIFAVCYSIIARLWNGPLFIRTRSKHFPWKLNYSFRWWGTHEWSAASVAISLIAVLVVFICKCLGGPAAPALENGLLFSVCLTSSIYSIHHHKIIKKFKEHSWWLTLLTASATFFLIITASAYADSFILNTTRIDPSKFPLSQKAVSTSILVTLWCYIATLILSVSALAKYFWDAMTIKLSVPNPEKTLGVTINQNDYRASAAHRRHKIHKLISNVGAVFTIIILMNFWEYISIQYGKIMQEVLVFTSFHLHPKDCGVRGASSEAWLAPIGENIAILASPKDFGYLFERVSCTILTKQEIHKNLIEKISKAQYL